MATEPTDYTGNSKKTKEPTNAPDKKIVKVVTGEVSEKKTGVGGKFKNIFLGADAKSIGQFAIQDVLIPEGRSILYRLGASVWEQFLFGSKGRRVQGRLQQFDYGAASRSYSYRNENRGVIDTRLSEPRNTGPLPSEHRFVGRSIEPQDRLFTDKNDAERVLETLKDMLDQHEFVSRFDFLGLIGRTEDSNQHTDHKFGWDSLMGVQIIHVRDGWVIDFPPTKEIL